MLRIFQLSIFITLSVNIIAQTGGLRYVRNMGGSLTDMFWGNVLLTNGNLVSVGYTESTNGQAQGNHGDRDCFVVCTSPSGIILWKKVLGGALWDGYSSAVDITTDGNIVVGFTVGSSDGDAVGNHGSWDVAFFKYTPDGILLWSKIYGGVAADILGKLKATPDGGIIAGIASSSSNSGNVTGTNHGMDDLWILKLDVNGSIQWQQLYGGTNNETTPAVALADDGGYFFATAASSTDGNLTGLLPTGATMGANDMWLLHTDAAGNILWSKLVGGSGAEESAVLYAHGGSFYLGMGTNSADRDVQVNLGLNDIALFKYNTAGTLQWKKQYASGAWDQLGDIVGLNGDMLTLTGGNYSYTFAGYPMPPADERMMIFRIDTLNGIIQWMKALGGNGRSQGNAISINNNGELFVSGLSTNTTGDIYANLGGYDAVAVAFTGGNRITGTVFVDANNNNLPDAGEVKPSYLMMQSSKGDSMYGLTSIFQGFYNLAVDTGLYTVKPLFNNNSYYTSVPGQFSHQFLSNNEVYTQNIALHAVPNVKDLTVSFTPLTIIRPGRVAQYQLTGFNIGTTTIAAGVLGFKKEPALSFAGFSTPPVYQSGDSVYWNFSNLAPFDSLNIIVNLSVPTTMTGGTPMNYITYITPIAGDSTPINNRIFYKHIVVNSFDPNCKTNNMADSIPLSAVQNGEYIYYTIQFQNTGTASAIDIFIKDTLSEKLRDSTLEIIRVSHPFTYSLKDRVATWNFFNINLPDSNANEKLSHGYIQYRIKAKPTLVTGDFINNTAAIYFDFNPPVITENNRLTVYVPALIVPATPVINPTGNVTSCLPVLLTTKAGSGYQWYKNGVAIAGATADRYTAQDPGVYTVTLTVNNVTSNPSAATTVSLGSITNVVITKTNSLMSVENPDATITYTWQKLNAQIWTDLNPLTTGTSYPVVSSGDYRVRATKGLCTAVSNSLYWEPAIVVTPADVRVFPNPAGNFLTIDKLTGSGWRTLEIYNFLGEKMVTPVLLNNRSEIIIDIRSFSSGIYLLVLRNNEKDVKRVKFVKQ